VVEVALPDGTRRHAVLPPITPFTTLSLRVLARRRFELREEDVPAFVELESGGPPPVACQVVGVGQLPSHPTKEGDRREQKKGRRAQPDSLPGEVAVPEQVIVSMSEIADSAREGLLALTVGTGLQLMGAMFDGDVTGLCGPAGSTTGPVWGIGMAARTGR
jgi:hypothetical protein